MVILLLHPGSYLKGLYIIMNKIKILIISTVIGLVCTFVLTNRTDADTLQEDIAGKILRFHVIANSDSEEDQNLKLKVKNAVVEYLNPYFNETLSLEESKEIINTHFDDIIALCQNVIKENGYSYEINASITTCYFPIKSYGDVTLPAGNYEAFRIEIGNSAGKNWWCILYPPLCFVDVSYGIVPDESKLLLKNILDEDEYASITEDSDTSFRFKYLTFLNGLFD